MKKIIVVCLALALLLTLAACTAASDRDGGPTDAVTVSPESKPAVEAEGEESTAPVPSEDGDTAQARKDTLVVYFSATGTTKAVAQTIAAITDADLYEIQPSQSYTSEDLNWRDNSSRSTKEQNDKNARPAIGSEAISLTGYTTIYIGYPIWWGEEPRIMDTFVESYDFDGITVIPFCTSSSSGIGRSGKNLADYAGSGTWLEGKRFGAGASESELRSWIESLR